MSGHDSSQPVRTRRAVLGAAAAGAVALSVGRFARPDAASAATGAMQYGADNDAGDAQTSLHSTTPFQSLEVHGTGANAIGGYGEGAESTGVIGVGSGPGFGVRGVSDNGVGLHGESAKGFALKAWGRAGFSTAGTAAVERHRASVRVKRPEVAPSSLVIATIQRDRTDTYVRGVVVSDGSFRILLNRQVASRTKVAYIVIEKLEPFPD